MTKIILKASDPLHRDIARLFIGQEIEEDFWLNGIDDNPSKESFLCRMIDAYDYTTLEFEREITIDLDSTPMDLRMALGTDIVFRSVDKYGHIVVGQVIRVSNDPITSVGSEIVSIMESTKIYKNFNADGETEIKLSIPWLKSKGIEVIE